MFILSSLHLFSNVICIQILSININFQTTSSMISITGTSKTTISLDYTSLQIIAAFTFLSRKWVWSIILNLNIVIYDTNDGSWILFRSSYFQEWIWVIFSGFTIFTKIKIFLNWRFVTSSDYRIHFTTITYKMMVHNFFLFVHFVRILVLLNHLTDLRNQILEFGSNKLFHPLLTFLFH